MSIIIDLMRVPENKLPTNFFLIASAFFLGFCHWKGLKMFILSCQISPRATQNRFASYSLDSPATRTLVEL
jgi:hypothetical protein